MHRIRRSRVVRHIEVYDVSLSDDVDPRHLIEEHAHQFDSDMTSGGLDARQVSSTVEELEWNELHLEVVDRDSARVIPMRRRQ